LTPENKKETAKVPPGTPASKVGVPQATVQLQKKPGVSASSSPKSVSTSASLTVAQPTKTVEAPGEISMVFGAVALALSVIALGVQLWTLLGS